MVPQMSEHARTQLRMAMARVTVCLDLARQFTHVCDAESVRSLLTRMLYRVGQRTIV